MGFSKVLNGIVWIRMAIVRVIGTIFVLLGLLILNAAFPPVDLESGAVLAMGTVSVALGGYALLRPENVRLRSGTRDKDKRRHGRRR